MSWEKLLKVYIIFYYVILTVEQREIEKIRNTKD